MILYVMRHGEAVSAGRWAGEDAARPLTTPGEARLAEAARAMKRLGVAPKALLASPLLRARRTAEIVAANLDSLSAIALPELASGATAEAIRNVCLKHQERSPLFIVGHMPDLALFVGRLLGDPRVIEQGFRPGETVALSLASLERAWGSGELQWRHELDEWPTLEAF